MIGQITGWKYKAIDFNQFDGNYANNCQVIIMKKGSKTDTLMESI